MGLDEEITKRMNNRKIDFTDDKWKKISDELYKKDEKWDDTIYHSDEESMAQNLLKLRKDRYMRREFLDIYEDILVEVNRKKLRSERVNLDGDWKNNYNLKEPHPNKELESRTKVKQEIIRIQEEKKDGKELPEKKDGKNQGYRANNPNLVNPKMQDQQQLCDNLLKELGINEAFITNPAIRSDILNWIEQKGIEKGILDGNALTGTREGAIYELGDPESVENLISEIKNDSQFEVDEKGNFAITHTEYNPKQMDKLQRADRISGNVNEDGLLQRKHSSIERDDKGNTLFDREEQIYSRTENLTDDFRPLYTGYSETKINLNYSTQLIPDGTCNMYEIYPISKGINENHDNLLRNMENWDKTMWERQVGEVSEKGNEYLEKEKIQEQSQHEQEAAQAIPQQQNDGILKNLLQAYDVADITQNALESAMQTIKSSAEAIRTNVERYVKGEDNQSSK